MAPKEVDVCVVGLGVSTLALVRRLAAGNLTYVVVSDKDFGVWAEAARRGEDFDLLSSSATAAFSWWDFDDDFHFFSASEYYQRLCNDVPDHVKERLVRMRAGLYAEQEDGRFAVHAEGEGEPAVLCRHLVVTTGQTVSAKNIFDNMEASLRVRDKTVFITGYGDTTNMLMARLMLGNNRVIFSTKHFVNLDKLVKLPGGCYAPFDVFEEYQHMLVNNHERSHHASWHATVPPYHTAWLSRATRKRSGIEEVLHTEDFYRHDLPHPVQSFLTRKGVSAGYGYPVKYWPVDGYFKFYDRYKDHMLTHRMLLNDTFFFMQLGRVRVVHPKRVAWTGPHTCCIDGEEVHVDVRMESECGYPRPVEVALREGEVYRYRYRDHLHGLWSAERPNLYFVGAERPTTGAFAGTAEMQCELIHWLITRPAFRERMVQGYRENHKRWTHNYLESGTGNPGLEHTQFTGATNLELARLMGVHWTLWESLRKGRLAEYVGGTFLPMRFGEVTGQEGRYLAFCRRWTNRFIADHLSRDLYLYPPALNLVALGLANRTLTVALAGLALLTPIVQKFAKCCLIGVVSYGPGFGMSHYHDIMLISVMCMVFNLVKWLVPARLPPRLLTRGWVACAVQSGLPVMLCTIATRIYRHLQSGSNLFNDVQGRRRYADRFEEYLAAVRATGWYQRYASEPSPPTKGQQNSCTAEAG
eukprot:Sspe_Gene.73902::Locus_45118_Transcript_1_1_Confidence_1.000_Length_2245::g.73902::m.73902